MSAILALADGECEPNAKVVNPVVFGETPWVVMMSFSSDNTVKSSLKIDIFYVSCSIACLS